MEGQTALPAQEEMSSHLVVDQARLQGVYDIWAEPRRVQKIFFQLEFWENIMMRTEWVRMNDENKSVEAGNVSTCLGNSEM